MKKRNPVEVMVTSKHLVVNASVPDIRLPSVDFKLITDLISSGSTSCRNIKGNRGLYCDCNPATYLTD
jgi:hypothetical protein